MRYADGQTVCPNDVVNYAGGIGDVEKVIAAGTDESRGYQCEDSGGILVRMRDDGDYYLLEPENAEDLELVARGQSGQGQRGQD